MKKFLTLLLGMACVHAQGIAFDWNADLALTLGYRNDEIKTTIHAYDPPGTLILQDRLKVKNIDIYEIGLKANLAFCDPWRNEWFIKGFADFGRPNKGHYREDVAFPIIVSTITKGHVNKGYSQDDSIGIGYFYSFGDCCLNDSFLNGFKVGPVVGYSYDFLKVRMGKMRTNGVVDPILNHLSYDMRWQGPWLGCELEYAIDCFRMNLGYEFHWSNWRANWTLKGPDDPHNAFSDKRKSSHAYGNLVFLDGAYTFCNCWELGLGLKYQQWKAGKGRERPRAGSFADVGLSDTEVDKVPKATWRSFQVQLAIGYHF